MSVEDLTAEDRRQQVVEREGKRFLWFRSTAGSGLSVSLFGWHPLSFNELIGNRKTVSVHGTSAAIRPLQVCRAPAVLEVTSHLYLLTSGQGYMRSGNCPKCSSTDLYSTAGRSKSYRRSLGVGLLISPWRAQLAVTTFICRSCGYIERYLSDKDEIGRLPKH